MLIVKLYYTVPEILERWRISEADLIYLAENDRLRLSVRVFDLPLEFGGYDETPEGERFSCSMGAEARRWPARAACLRRIPAVSLRQLQVSDFRTPRAGYATLWDETKPLFVMIGDLLIRREERDRFEAESFGERLSISTEPGPRIGVEKGV